MKDIITVQHVTKSFGKVVAVNDVSFSVAEGEIFGFLGPNGAGKSTTIKMLTTLLRPTSGTLGLAGHDVIKEQDAARKIFGIVFQYPSLDGDLTAIENLTLHAVLYGLDKKSTQVRMKELLTLVELWERKDSLVKTFSGGMKRRLEIARGLLHHPKILFLDEPTLGLDAQTRNLSFSSAIGATVNDMPSFMAITNFFVVPLFFLSGSMYPLDHIPAVMKAIAYVNPLSYAVDAMRATLINQSYFGLPTDFAVMTGTLIILMTYSIYRFRKIEA